MAYRNPALSGPTAAELCNLGYGRQIPGRGLHSYTEKKTDTSTIGLKREKSACNRFIGTRQSHSSFPLHRSHLWWILEAFGYLCGVPRTTADARMLDSEV